MPAEIVPGEFCASYFATYEVTGSKGDVYVVSWYGAEQAPTCHKKEGGEPCKAWQFAPRDEKQCKHTKYVWEHACMWNCQWFEGNPDHDLKPSQINSSHLISAPACPNCDGPLVAVLIAV